MILESLTLKIEALQFFETFVAICQSMQVIPKDLTLQKHTSEKLKIFRKIPVFLTNCVFDQWGHMCAGVFGQTACFVRLSP